MDLLSVRRPRARGLSLGRHGVCRECVEEGVVKRRLKAKESGRDGGSFFFLYEGPT
jgi:hypothetical protein